MKKLFTKKILLVLLLTINSGLLFAQQLLTENFSYTGALTANGWTAHSVGGTNPISTTTGLTYTGLATSGIGNAALVNNLGGEDINIPFTNQTTDGESIFLSCMVNVTDPAATKTGDYFLHLGATSGTSLTNFGARIGVRITASGVNFGISNGTITYGSTNFAKNTTYLLVAKYTISVAGNDPVSLWIIPSGVPATETDAGTPESTTSATAGQNNITSVALRQGSNSTSVQTVVDGIVVGLTWADVLPTVATGPTLGTTGNATGLSTVQGIASASGSFNLTGSNLTGFPGSITATASSTDFEVSNDNSTWGPSATIAYTAATLAATPVYVRISATAPLGNVTGTVALSGGGAASINANVGGNVLVAEPTVQTSNIIVSGTTDNGFILDWTNGNGTSRIVAVRQTSTAAVSPVDGSLYTTSLGGGNTIWYNGNAGGPVTVTGLTAGTSYSIQAYEYNGTTTGTTNYLTTTATNNPLTVSTTGISPNIQQGFFTSVATPLYGARSAIKIPTVAIGTLSGLTPNTTYRYFSTGAASTDFGTTASAGTLILNDYTAATSFFTASTGSLSAAGQYGRFTSDASGKFTGTFGYFSSTNTRFDSGAHVYITVTLGEDVTPFTTKFRFALDQFITMLDWGNLPEEGSFIKGASLASPNNIVALWKSIDGNLVATRPLSMTLVENNATTTAVVAPYDETDGSWNTVIPNDNPEGVRLIQQFTPTGIVIGCNSDADGTWPSGVSTSDPVNGSTTAGAIQITITDAPLNAGACFGVLPVSILNFTAQKASRTVQLKWSTSQELNSRNFVIERSNDNRNWTSIGTVAAAGTSSTTRNYSFFDNNPAKGVNYYRLKQVDLDNRTATSAVRSVLFSEQNVISVAPNPATDFINVYIAKNDQKTTQVIVADINGKVVEKHNTADQLLVISTSRYAKGVYFVKVITDEQTTTQKVIVQ